MFAFFAGFFASYVLYDITPFFVMKSNQKVGALPFEYVKTHVASECLGRFCFFFIPGFQSSNFKKYPLVQNHAWRVPHRTAPRDLFHSLIWFLHRTRFFFLFWDGRGGRRGRGGGVFLEETDACGV